MKLSIKIRRWAILSFMFVSVDIPCEFVMVTELHILLSAGRGSALSLQIYTFCITFTYLLVALYFFA